jgi:hypothetical protein
MCFPVPLIIRITEYLGTVFGALEKLGNCLSELNNSAPTGRIFIKFDIWVLFENLLRNFKFY